MDGTQEKPPEIDIDAEWEKACIAFANTTKGKQLKGRPLPTPEQISESIRNKAKSSKEPGKWNKLGKVLTSVGFALLDLGQVAGQIASMVRIISSKNSARIHLYRSSSSAPAKSA